MMILNDTEKISAIRTRNEKLTSEIYELYRSEFIGYFKQRLRKKEEIIDIYQLSFMELCNKIYTQRINETNLTSSLKTYLFGIGKFKVMEGNRPEPIIMEIKEELPDIVEEDAGFDSEKEKIIRKAVEKMGEPCHTILVKQYWEDKSGEEIANEMNYKNEDTVKTQKYKCMQKLKRNLAGIIN